MSELSSAEQSHREDAAALLASPEAEGILVAALGTIALPLDSWKLDAVHARPGAEISATYDVVAGGETIYVVASTAELTPTERERAGAVRLESEKGVIHVWRHPHDPKLPGLSAVCTPPDLAARLTGIGWGQLEVTALAMLVLRPMRRAVLRARIVRHSVEETVYVKVLRPDRVALVLKRHSLATFAPQAFDAGDGIVVIIAAAGTPLAEFLFHPDAKHDVKPMALLEALDSLDSAAMDLPRRSSPAELIGTYADAATSAGWDRAQIRVIATAVADVLSESYGDIVATHGDFHAANVFVDDAEPPRVSALIDIDTLGPGLRVDDLACMLAHLYTLPTFDAAAYPSVPALSDQAFNAFAQQVPERQLRVRTAAVLVSLLTGCDDRARGQMWLDRALWLVGEQALSTR